jgi:hypothetical protein
MAHTRSASSPGTRRVRRGIVVTVLFLVTLLLGLAAPLVLFFVLWSVGWDISDPSLIVVLAAVALDIVIGLLAGIARLRMPGSPRAPRTAYAPATALVLSNAGDPPAMVADTARTLLGLPYLAPLQVIVLCSTAEQEEALEPLRGDRDARLIVISGTAGTGSNQIRAAVPAVAGRFVGLFTAGEIPLRDVFTRAWIWLSHGSHAVQGGILLAEPDASWVTRMAAVESTAGMAPTPLLMAWEDIDSSRLGNTFFRTSFLDQLVSGEHVGPVYLAYDPELTVRRPGPTTLAQFWSRQLQRELDLLRLPVLPTWRRLGRSPLTRRWTLPLFHDLVWHPAYVWLALQVLTVSAFRAWAHGSIHSAGWAVPLVILLGLYALGTTVLRTVFAALLAPVSVRRHRSWFLWYALLSILFQEGARHTTARIAQLLAIVGRSNRPAAAAVTKQPVPATSLVPADHEPEGESSAEPLPDVAAEEIPAASTGSSDEAHSGIPALADLLWPAGGDLPVLAAEAHATNGQSSGPPLPSELPPAAGEPAALPCAAGDVPITEAVRGMKDLIASLVRQVNVDEARNRELRQRIEILEAQLVQKRTGAVALRELPPHGVRDEEVQAMRETFGALAANPSSILALASVSQHARALAHVVEEYNQMQRALALMDEGV